MFPLVFVTFATFVSELLQPNFHAYEPAFVLSEIIYSSPMPNVRLLVLILMLDGAGFTVTLQVFVSPFAVLTVIVAVPDFLAVTVPLLFTVATDVLLLDHFHAPPATVGLTLLISV